MTVSPPFSSLWLATITQTQPWIVFSMLCLTIYLISVLSTSRRGIPYANAPKWYQSNIPKKIEFLKNGMQVYLQSRVKYGNRPFRLLTNLGDMIVLPPDFAHRIRNEEKLSFSSAILKDFNTHIPGFEPFGTVGHDAQMLQTLIRKQLTKYLNTVTKPLASESTFAIDLLFGRPADWQEIRVKDTVLDLVARLSSRVFLGEELCRNDDWLRITKDYTIDGFKATFKLNIVPPFLRYYFSWFSPDCKYVRDELQRARDLITPVIERRRRLKSQAKADGKTIPTPNDAIEWAEAESGGKPYDPAILQLILSVAAIHTTTDLICQTMLHLANETKNIVALREEIVAVLKVQGWQKNALYNMKLLDSAIKEAQRLKPIGMLVMRRLAVSDVVLPTGFKIHKGERIIVDSAAMSDPQIYPEPAKFDMYRFKRMREDPTSANKAQLVATSPDMLAFGHGMHACPGRFFAANETKIALCHLLLKYDWKLAEDTDMNPLVTGIALSVKPTIKLLYKRRKAEIDLDCLEAV